MADERQMSVAEWQASFDDLRARAKEPTAALSLEDFRALAHLELIDRVKELEEALGNVERVLRHSRQMQTAHLGHASSATIVTSDSKPSTRGAAALRRR